MLRRQKLQQILRSYSYLRAPDSLAGEEVYFLSPPSCLHVSYRRQYDDRAEDLDFDGNPTP